MVWHIMALMARRRRTPVSRRRRSWGPSPSRVRYLQLDDHRLPIRHPSLCAKDPGAPWIDAVVSGSDEKVTGRGLESGGGGDVDDEVL